MTGWWALWCVQFGRKCEKPLASVQIRQRGHPHARSIPHENARARPLPLADPMNGPWAINGFTRVSLPTRARSRSRARAFRLALTRYTAYPLLPASSSPRPDAWRKNCALPSNKLESLGLLESLEGLIGFNGVFDGRDAGLSISRMELEYS